MSGIITKRSFKSERDGSDKKISKTLNTVVSYLLISPENGMITCDI